MTGGDRERLSLRHLKKCEEEEDVTACSVKLSFSEKCVDRREQRLLREAALNERLLATAERARRYTTVILYFLKEAAYLLPTYCHLISCTPESM